MAIKVTGEGRYKTLELTVDTEADIGPQVVIAQAAGYSWKQITTLFGKSRQTLDQHAKQARASVGGDK